jgi:hypothetical protein
MCSRPPTPVACSILKPLYQYDLEIKIMCEAEVLSSQKQERKEASCPNFFFLERVANILIPKQIPSAQFNRGFNPK